MSHSVVCCGTNCSGRKNYINQLLKETYPKGALIVPTRRYAQERAKELLKYFGVSTLYGDMVTDFISFTKTLLQRQCVPIRLLEDWEQALLIKSIILSDEGKHRFSTFSGVLAPDNLAEHFKEIIFKLKQTGTTPEDFFEKVKGTSIEPWDEVLLWMYRSYQQKLTENHWYDIPGIFWQAEIECLTAKPNYIKDIDFLAFDGFDDFTPSEIRLIRALAPHFEKTIIGINLDPSPNRTDLYQLAVHTLEELKKSLNPEIMSFESPSPENCIEFVAQNLFWRDKPREFVGKNNGVIEITPYPNRETEIREIARKIKKYIVKENILPQQIAFVYRQISSVQPIIKRIFREFGIPVRFHNPQRLTDTLTGNFLQHWFSQLKEEKLSAFLNILYDPLWNSPAIIRTKFFLLLQQAEISIDTPIRNLRREMDKISSLSSQETDKKVSQEEFSQFYEHIICWLSFRDKFSKKDTLNRYIDSVIYLLNFVFQNITTGMWSNITENPEAEYRAYRQIIYILKNLPVFIEVETLSLEEFSRIFIGTLNNSSYHNAETEFGVSCMDLPLIRNLEYEYIFVGGIEEGIIPFSPGINAIYSDKDFTILRETGIPIDDARTHVQREWLFFQKIFDTAKKGVFLSYAFFSETQRQRTPSLLLREVQDVCSFIQGHQLSLTSPAELPFAEPCSTSELKKVVFLLQSEKEIETQYPEEYLRALSLWKREETAQNPYLGYLKSDDLNKWLFDRFGTQHIYSADQIETYKKCPFLFFSRRVLGLQEWEEELTEPNALMCGAWAHEVLHILFRDYLKLVKEKDKNTLQAIISNLLQEVANRDYKIKSLPVKTVEITLKRIERYLNSFLVDALIDNDWEPKYFELSFGYTTYDEEDERSISKPFIMHVNDMNISFSGRIDRIDQHVSNNELRIIDYKWKETPSINDMKKANSIQLILYTLAVENHLFPDFYVPQSFFVSITGNKIVSAPWNPESRGCIPRKDVEQRVMQEITATVHNILEGNFSPTTDSKNCDRCKWKTACRYKKGERRTAELVEQGTYDEFESK